MFEVKKFRYISSLTFPDVTKFLITLTYLIISGNRAFVLLFTPQFPITMPHPFS